MKDKEIKDLIEKGHILCRVIFEMAGNPKEHVEKTLKDYINKIKEDPSYIFMNEDYAPAEENDGVWSVILEADVLSTNFEKLNILCFNLSPASIEIIEPETFALTQKDITYWYNDILSKIHEVSASLKNLNGENDLLKVNLNRAIKNCVVLSLNEPRTMDEISQKVGVDKNNLQPFVDAMIKEKTIILEGNKYVRHK
ncbi:MAG: hypothetical protein ACP5NV_01690 [Candidatus Woesearchaeota archaeon]